MILAGAIPACFLAIFLDLIIGKVENIVVPIGIRSTPVKANKNSTILGNKKFKLAALVLVLVLILSSVAMSFGKSKNTIVVASKNFNEQLILGDMVSSLLEEKTDIKVERKLNLECKRYRWWT